MTWIDWCPSPGCVQQCGLRLCLFHYLLEEGHDEVLPEIVVQKIADCIFVDRNQLFEPSACEHVVNAKCALTKRGRPHEVSSAVLPAEGTTRRTR